MKYYITTPIYYVNAAPHIGHTYTTMVADTIKRYKTMCGYDVVLTTGTDEHGQKIERAAKASGRTEQQFTDAVSNEFRATWAALHLSIDRFQRTTAPDHHKAVCELYEACKANGYIYKGSYTGQYCVSCELYVTDAKPGDNCPDCGRPTETVTEENLYFKLSAFQDRLLELFERDPQFVQPDTRRNEVLAFIKQGLTDLSISRTTIKWGIPVPDEPAHVFYVWFDALMTYISATGDKRDELWPADLHLIGKEIVRFHAIYWPAFLMAANWPLPKRIYAHGFLLFDNDKMSKSKGNLLRPMPIHEVIGGEALRYFLLREVSFGNDGNFSLDALVTRYNADLANGLGNLASRTLAMIQQYRGGVIPNSQGDDVIRDAATQAIAQYVFHFDDLAFAKGLEALWALLAATDKFIVERAPWKLVKDPDAQVLLDDTLYTAAEVVRIATVLMAPVMPEAAEKLWAQLGYRTLVGAERIPTLEWGQLPSGQATTVTTGVFPRYDVKPTVDKVMELEEAEGMRQRAILGQRPKEPEGVRPPAEPSIAIDDFVKVDLRVGLVLSAVKVKGADKLLHLSVDIGEEKPRSIVAGIALAYEPESLVGRKVVIVANLEPRKLRGLESQGMIVAASLENTKPVLAAFLEDVPVGARLK
jgi:methionyl-tRNA synthetase